MSDSFEHHLRECSASSDAPYAFTLTLPSVKKPIQCYIWGPSPLQVDDKPSGTPKKSGTNIHLCIYTHGAGGTCASPGSDLLCRGLTQASSSGSPSELTVLGFDGPMHLKTRTATFTAVINWASESSNVQCISLAGRSMGCRAAVVALTEALSNSKLSQKLVLQSYPLKGAGKGTKDDERKQILLDLPGTAHVLFESGDHDDMCALDDVESLRKGDMAAATSLVTIAGADHGLQLVAGVAGRGQKAQATEELGLAAGKVAGEWLLSGNGVASHGTLRVLTGAEDESKSSLIDWSGLTRETTAPAKKATSTSKPSAPKSGRKRKIASPLAEPESSTQSSNIRTQAQSRTRRKK